MPDYRVIVTIDQSAASPREAAQEARDDLQTLGPRIHRFTVIDLDTEVETNVDLNEPVSGWECVFDRRLLEEGR